MNKHDFLILASGHYLTTYFPEDLLLGTSEADQFILDNAWEPFQNYDAQSVWKVIEDLANTLEEVYKAGVQGK